MPDRDFRNGKELSSIVTISGAHDVREAKHVIEAAKRYIVGDSQNPAQILIVTNEGASVIRRERKYGPEEEYKSAKQKYRPYLGEEYVLTAIERDPHTPFVGVGQFWLEFKIPAYNERAFQREVKDRLNGEYYPGPRLYDPFLILQDRIAHGYKVPEPKESITFNVEREMIPTEEERAAEAPGEIIPEELISAFEPAVKRHLILELKGKIASQIKKYERAQNQPEAKVDGQTVPGSNEKISHMRSRIREKAAEATVIVLNAAAD